MWLFLVLIAAGAGWYFFAPEPDIHVVNFPPPNPEIVMLGDSMTSGVGASKGRDLPVLIGRRLGMAVQNHGVPGETSGGAVARAEFIFRTRSPGTVIVFLGGNDVLQQISAKQVEANLVQIIELCQRKGAMVALVGISGRPGDGITSMFKRVAQERGCVFVPEALDGIFLNPAMKADAIHPNDAGYAKIADRIAEKLKPYLLTTR